MQVQQRAAATLAHALNALVDAHDAVEAHRAALDERLEVDAVKQRLAEVLAIRQPNAPAALDARRVWR